MTRLWEVCHQAVRISRMNPAAMPGLAPSLLSSPASFGQAIGQAIEVNLTARGEEPPIPRMDNKKRRDLLEELMKTWPGILFSGGTISRPPDTWISSGMTASQAKNLSTTHGERSPP